MCSNSSTNFSRGPALPEEIHLLCTLHNIGATASEKSLTLQQISGWTTMEISTLSSYLQKLTELGYVQFIKAEGVDKYHVTINGIRKVLSIYS